MTGEVKTELFSVTGVPTPEPVPRSHHGEGSDENIDAGTCRGKPQQCGVSSLPGTKLAQLKKYSIKIHTERDNPIRSVKFSI